MLFERRAFTADRRRNDTVHKAISMNTSQWINILTFVAKHFKHELENLTEIMNTMWKLQLLKRR